MQRNVLPVIDLQLLKDWKPPADMKWDDYHFLAKLAVWSRQLSRQRPVCHLWLYHTLPQT